MFLLLSRIVQRATNSVRCKVTGVAMSKLQRGGSLVLDAVHQASFNHPIHSSTTHLAKTLQEDSRD